MRPLRTISLLSLILVFAVGCDSSKNDDITLDDLIGTWSATSMVYTRNSDGQSVDIIGTLAGEYRITVLSGGRARTWVDVGTYQDEWDSAISLDGNKLTVDPVETGRDTNTATITLSGNVLTVTDTNVEFDFTLSGGTPDPAKVVITMQRQ